MNIQPTNSKAKQLQQAWLELVLNTNFTHYITFVFNRKDLTSKQAEKLICKFGVRINRLLHGANYNKKPNSKRTSFSAFPENMNSNLHYHAVVHSCDPVGFQREAEAIWHELVKSGHLHMGVFEFRIGKFTHFLVEAPLLETQRKAGIAVLEGLLGSVMNEKLDIHDKDKLAAQLINAIRALVPKGADPFVAIQRHFKRIFPVGHPIHCYEHPTHFTDEDRHAICGYVTKKVLQYSDYAVFFRDTGKPNTALEEAAA